MRIVSLSYFVTHQYTQPQQWLERTAFFNGILTALAKQGHEVISIEQVGCTADFMQNGVHYCFVPFNKKTPLFPLALHRMVSNVQPDVVLLNGLIYPLQTIQLRRTLGKSPIIYALHHAEQPGTGLMAMLQRWAAKGIDGWQFASAAMGTANWADILPDNSTQRIFEVMEGSSAFYKTDTTAARQQLGITAKDIYLWVGRLDANKDPLTAVQAFIQFYQQHPQAVLYMIFHTTDLLPAVQKLAAICKGIVLVGQVPHHQLQHWYNAADFFITASHYEGSGIALCEAMSCGCIPVATSILSFMAMLGHGRCGLQYPPGDVAALVNVLHQSQQIDRPMHEAAVLQQFREKLSFEAIAAAMVRNIQSLM